MLRYILLLFICSSFSCNHSARKATSNQNKKKIDTITDPIIVQPCSVSLEKETILVKAISIPKQSTGKARLSILIDSNHQIKKIKLIHLFAFKNKNAVKEWPGEVDISDLQMKEIIGEIYNNLKSKINCTNEKSATNLNIPADLLFE